ncbi:hypothetical protein A2V68_00685 [candidate division Kazan bacterium RBG_13_50_9]|uniref:DNA replication and repair protein RecF n=1 Tax=candidate division Kazan bacterium RBG_13_50_9 TaxID=1798535 RepID=A0A1F4NSM4_UNCK3|nr:MAG: hypothetical protein A2V68_00685 [candidate division Kazan bacterium RBG_13_50_9]
MEFVSSRLLNFRNIPQIEIAFGKKNFLVGLNAQGKTNILEALHYLSLGGSFRSSREQWLIRFGELAARIEATVRRDNGEEEQAGLLLERDEMGIKKTFRLNGRTVAKGEFLGNVLTILFAPDEVGLLKLQPDVRRALMNEAIAQVDPTYWSDLTDYNKALKQRNQLLFLIKQHRADMSELGGWDDRLAALGSRIIESRQELIEGLNRFIGQLFADLAGQASQKLRLAYKTEAGAIGPDQYSARLIKNRDADITWGHTTFGPHRDDLVFLVDDLDIRYTASQGEFRLIVLALKLAEGRYLKEALGERPIYLLDDVFSELDKERGQRVLGMLDDSQVIVTTTSEEMVRGEKEATILVVEEGQVKEGTRELA